MWKSPLWQLFQLSVNPLNTLYSFSTSFSYFVISFTHNEPHNDGWMILLTHLNFKPISIPPPLLQQQFWFGFSLIQLRHHLASLVGQYSGGGWITDFDSDSESVQGEVKFNCVKINKWVTNYSYYAYFVFFFYQSLLCSYTCHRVLFFVFPLYIKCRYYSLYKLLLKKYNTSNILLCSFSSSVS